ncbi:MAG: DUF2800 domain-containing protein [Bacteroidetes bacterium]|nr:DUF2800 domain-containing protein [Bacteroidota bacterium]MCL6101005.1 DUF2800 domain-containing protein [Bacteroidota bacterium]
MSHAILSPSGASRWLNCTPSACLEQQFPDSSGEAAKEGTLAHWLGETLLKNHLGLLTNIEANETIERIESDPRYTADMMDHASGYAAFVMENFEAAKKVTKDAVIQIEAQLNLTDYVPEGFGTGDAVIIADGNMGIIDLKYGKGVMVSCENNKQMMLYALGALREYDYMYDIQNVRMWIYQPRMDNISSFEMSVADLQAWAENELKPLAQLAFDGLGEFKVGDHCRFCRAKAQCKANANENLKLARYDFAESVLLTDTEISDILERASAFKTWLTSIEEMALTEAVDNGKQWPGFKLVEGRSNRIYSDEDKVAKELVKNGFNEDQIYTKKILGITAMEKAITKKTFESLLGELIIKPQGKPTLVPVSDKRTAWNSTESAKNDFSNN